MTIDITTLAAAVRDAEPTAYVAVVKIGQHRSALSVAPSKRSVARISVDPEPLRLWASGIVSADARRLIRVVLDGIDAQQGEGS